MLNQPQTALVILKNQVKPHDYSNIQLGPVPVVKTLVPLLIEIAGTEVTAMMANYGEENFRVVTYPELDLVGIYNRNQIKVLGSIINLL